MGTPLTTKQEAWQLAATSTSAVTTPSATTRDADAVKALAGAIILDIMPAQNLAMFRFSGVTNDSDNIYDILFMADGEDHYTRVQTLTCTTGTQTSGIASQEFADTIVQSNTFWHKTWSIVSNANNYIAEAAVDVLGIKKIALIPTTIVTGSSVWYRGA
jgi:hypothetical protein